jgi:hypothetical protein
MVVVVVDPDGVKTCETVGEFSMETLVVPPDEVTTETEVGTEVTYEAVTNGDGLTNADDETMIGLPDSVTYGAEVGAVSTWTVPPETVV